MSELTNTPVIDVDATTVLAEAPVDVNTPEETQATQPTDAQKAEMQLMLSLGRDAIEHAAGTLVNVAASIGQPYLNIFNINNQETEEPMGKAMVLAIASKDPGIIDRIQGALSVILNPGTPADAPRIIVP